MQMTTTVMKTKAERGLALQYEALASTLPGGPEVRKSRDEAIASFNVLGLPHRRIEEWKYTDLRSFLKEALPLAAKATAPISDADLSSALGPLAAVDCDRLVFVDGRHSKALSSNSNLEGVRVAAASEQSGGDRLARTDRRPADAVAALNAAFATDGAIVDINPASAQLDRPLMLVFLATASTPASITTRSFINVGRNIAATLIEVHAQIGKAAGHSNSVLELTVGDGAAVDHAKVALGVQDGIHLSSWDVAVGSHALYRSAQLTPGAGLARNQVRIELSGRDGKFDFAGIALGRHTDHIDTTMEINHLAPGCTSRELFKTVIDDRARAVFQGKVHVDRLAQKTDGKQMAKALMLSPDAEFDSKPELEIFADDVVCGHGSTCAELDPGLIFYCQSRGIPEAQARALLIESFVGEALEKIESPSIRRAFSEIAMNWLAAKQA